LAISKNKGDHVGIHLNLTEGFPLTQTIRNESRFCSEEGLFHFKRYKRIVSLTTSEKKAVIEELTSQIHLCRELGISISHADSHNHIHEEPGIFFLLLDILKKEKIPFLRLTNNIGKTSLLNKLYRSSYNTILNFNNLAGTNYFGSAANLTNYKKIIERNSLVELMIHPGQILDNQIYDVFSNENLSLILPGIINGNNLISYNQLVRR
jgi:predicted glycoside hydrolase/deacetylase ChbG (UPF0249 family)